MLGLRGCVWWLCVWVSGVAACSGSGVSGSHVVCGVCVVLLVAMSVPFAMCVWFFALGRVSCSGVPVPPSGCAPVLPVVPRFVCLFALWCPPGLVS